MKDILLVTVDAWRYDALGNMPSLRSAVPEDSTSTDAIVPSNATAWVSPSLLHSKYYCDVFTGRRSSSHRFDIQTDIPSLPQQLGDAGYTTGAFVATNPNLRQYADHFDTYWDGHDGEVGESRFAHSPIKKWGSRAYRTVFLKKFTSATAVANRATEWYRCQESPRFFWIHLMEPHEPYYPGLRRGFEVGLTKTYRASIANFLRSADASEFTPTELTTLKHLYDRCIDRLDEQMAEVLGVVDADDILCITGDHGEEFHHGWIGHKQLYDEVVRVPLLTYNIEHAPDRTARQVDIVPTLLDAAGIEYPSGVAGTPVHTEDDDPAYLLATNAEAGSAGVIYVGLRTDDRKYIRTYDVSQASVIEVELYDLESDPSETENLATQADTTRFEQLVDEFVDDHAVIESLRRIDHNLADEDPELDDDVQNRLADLGYM
jgi:arylsulfatase A-like enzyme